MLLFTPNKKSDITLRLFDKFSNKHGIGERVHFQSSSGRFACQFLGKPQVDGTNWRGYAILTRHWDSDSIEGYQFMVVKASTKEEVLVYAENSTYYCRVLVNLHKQQGPDTFGFSYADESVALLDPAYQLMQEVQNETREMLEYLGLTWEPERSANAA